MADTFANILSLNRIPIVEPEAPRVRPEDYDDRNGYRRDFLGADESFLLPLPTLRDHDDLVPVDRAPEGSPFELRYRNFSVVMSRSRRLCCVSAVNIDGTATFFRPKRPGWRLDPRLDDALQVDGESFYVPTVFDRGHMVRRLDPVWGEESDALLANRDTHHYTNACPQVHSFNDGEWGDLEDWILSQEQTRDSRGSVFTGPILQSDDPVYHEVAVPVRYYKIVAVVDDATDELSVTAFRLDQSDVMPPREGAPAPEAAFDPGRFVVHQVTVADLEEAGGMDFGRLRQFDVLAALPVPESAFSGPREVPLRSVREAVLWRAR